MKVKLFMKNTWHLIACLMLLVACSDDKVEDETTITLPPETETLFEKGVNFTTAAGTQSLEFTATENWNITTATTRNGEKRYYPLKGLVCCGNCKRALTRRKLRNEGGYFYQC